MSRPAEGTMAIRGWGGGLLRTATRDAAASHAGAGKATACTSRISIPVIRAAGPAGTQPQVPGIPHETPHDNDVLPQGSAHDDLRWDSEPVAGVEDSIMGHAQTCWPYPSVITASSRSVR
ncbi:MAG: hypothetical protein B7Z66_11625 [Chromatiales bacterium 21-64-14]|nr:MAG: hypothetical protein B7Z66_11625 [Chromatiales bacterium 21-64-14]